MSFVDYFAIDRMAEAARRDAQEYRDAANYCERRARELMKQAEQNRKYADNRDKDAERYKRMADEDYRRKHGEPYTIKAAV